MKTITVSASRTYDIRIGPGLLTTLGEAVRGLGKEEKVFLVSDTQVYPLYGGAAEASLKAAGYSVSSFVFPAGEESKNGETFLKLLNALAQAGLSRSDLLIALGGGVVGDLAGFSAACYLRGIRFVQIPTTLLAAVDSSVGGKTAIDLSAGKNLAGAFYQPSLVLCDLDALDTLPEDIFRDGCAEVIKYGVLYDPELFSQLETSGLDFDREAVIARCVALKRDVVMEDEKDTGSRMKLNLGHTFGHAVEAHSRFTLSHGKSVAIGLAIIARASASMGICSEADAARIVSVLKAFGLPVQTQYTAEALLPYLLSDKKRSGGTVNLILPEAIGRCVVSPTPVSQLQSILQAGL
ncbi:MAG TPA: 3-dehydroquinate synthase [Candidatus Faecousia intestinavium]|nr:3-dehydroquinate synthase [Candidatus Faecousia intestinavium]